MEVEHSHNLSVLTTLLCSSKYNVQDGYTLNYSDAPRFTCENCDGEVYTEYYKSTHDVESTLSHYQKK